MCDNGNGHCYCSLFVMNISSILMVPGVVIRGLHTRACKYNLSALETYFECEGVKPTNLNFT